MRNAMKPHLSIQATESDTASFSRETNLASSILVQGSVVILLITVTVIGVLLALSASFPNGKKEAVTEHVKLKGQMKLPENSTKQLYVVQSAFLEVVP